jgi:CHAT domain-containing protein
VQGEKHPDYALSLNNLAVLAWQEGKPAAASKQLALALQTVGQHLDSTFSALSARQRLQLLAQSRDYLDRYLSVSDQARLPAEEVYQAVLAGARQAEEQLLRDHPTLASLLDQLRQKRAGLAHLSAHPPPANHTEWSRRSREMDRQREDLEFRLADKSAAFRSLHSPDARALPAALPERAALVDLLEHWHWTPEPKRPGKWLFERRLVAFMLARDKEVARVDLGAVQPIAEAVVAWRKPMLTLSAVDDKTAQQLRTLLWDKLRPKLEGIDTLLVAPDGVLCALPWAALPGSKPGSYLLEEVALVQLTSAQQLLQPPAKWASTGLLVLGGLDYGKRLDRGPSWLPLPGTSLETNSIENLYRKQFSAEPAARKLTGPAASKDQLEAALAARKGEPGWRWLHLATHGYFKQPPTEPGLRSGSRGADLPALLGEDAPVFVDDPLLRAGLVLSGANTDPDRGILTALEVSNLDLRGCELVVLSACQTGLGKIENGEGLLGLQRAFHVAGARTVVSSLWSVNDAATSVLMEQFYANLWGERKMTKLEAFRSAQLFVLRHPERVEERAGELRKLLSRDLSEEELAARGIGKESVERPKGPREKPGERRSPPALWAGFVLSGEWR